MIIFYRNNETIYKYFFLKEQFNKLKKIKQQNILLFKNMNFYETSDKSFKVYSFD